MLVRQERGQQALFLIVPEIIASWGPEVNATVGEWFFSS